MKGYTEFLTRNIRLGRVSEVKLLSTVENLSQATERMESYVNQVRDLQALDAVPVEIAPASLEEYFSQLETAYTALAQQQEIHFEMDGVPAVKVLLDEKLLSRYWTTRFPTRSVMQKERSPWTCHGNMLC